MKSDLDRLMEERGLDAAIVWGKLYGNVPLLYMLNDAAVTWGMVVKKRGEEAVFVHSSYEVDEAAASGLALIDLARYDAKSIGKEKATPLEAGVELYRRIFDDLDVRGDVGFYGSGDSGAAWVLLQALDEAFPDIRVRGELFDDLISSARATKDASEAALIQEATRLTCEVVEATMDFVQRHAVKDEVLMTAKGTPLTIGMVKEQVNRLVTERRLELPEEFIFASGRDAGMGHSRGRPDDPLRLGQSIVFDIVPRIAGGYHSDCTRTYCLGYAPPEVAKAHETVVACIEAVMAKVAVGVETRVLQRTACDFFEERGYVTVATNRQTREGFIHSIGHGLGLAVHEEPFFGDSPVNTAVLQPGHVFTVEPGLYYPERGFGVRVEDVVWIDPEGQPCRLTDLSKELVVEMV